VINIYPVNSGEASWKSENAGTRRHGHGQARLPYLDVIRRIKDASAYQVSGEYAMLKAAAQNGCLDELACVLKALLGSERVGADGVLTYFARDAARYLKA